MKRKHFNAIIWVGIFISCIAVGLAMKNVSHMGMVANWAMGITGSLCIFDLVFLK